MAKDGHPAIEARDSERAVVGIVLATCGAAMAALAASGLTAACFSDPFCQAAYGAASGMLRAGKPIDLITLTDAVGADGLDLLTAMMSEAPIEAHGTHHAGRIVKAHKQRLLSMAARQALEAQKAGAEYVAVLKTLRDGIETAENSTRRTAGILSAAAFAAEKRPEPAEVIHGVLRAGQIGILAAASKAGKTWGMLALGLAVASGRNWLGWSTTPGRALYINGELPPWDLEKRLEKLCAAFELNEIPPGLDVWHLRGNTLTIRDMVPDVLRRQESIGAAYNIVIPDPLYCFNGGRDENDNSAQAVTMGELGEMSERSGAATMAAHHFSKGNQSLKEHLDRASGAGMFARAVDSFITLTRHEAEDAYSVEATTRSFAKPDAFVVRWECPLWRREDELDPARLKQALKPGARKAEYTGEDAAAVLPQNGQAIGYNEWKRLAMDKGMSEWQFKQVAQKDAVKRGLAVKIGSFYARANHGK